MDDKILLNLQEWRRRLKGAQIKQKKNITLILIILMLCMGLFFYLFFDLDAHAEKLPDQTISLEELDPLNKIGKGLNPEKLKCEKRNSFCDERKLVKKKIGNKEESPEKERAEELVAGHPIEEMIPFIYKKNKKVAAFLLAIGNKESKWGKFSPQKDGQNCYNYWGYRGGYKPTDSGYSCFDSAEQAVEEVGGRIENLLAQNIDTPQKMVVWKCGRDCGSDNQVAVAKWIADVDYYYKKLN